MTMSTCGLNSTLHLLNELPGLADGKIGIYG